MRRGSLRPERDDLGHEGTHPFGACGENALYTSMTDEAKGQILRAAGALSLLHLQTALLLCVRCCVGVWGAKPCSCTCVRVYGAAPWLKLASQAS